MRFPMLVLATVTAAFVCEALACENGSALSSSTANLSPAPAVLPAVQLPAAAPLVPAPALVKETLLPTTEIPLDPGPGQTVAVPPNSVPQPSPASEGDGEPMDDVDDEEVSATDKSGAGALTNEDEAPSGPADDSEGADIELNE